MKKRFLSLFLCAAILIGFFPTVTRAEDDNPRKITCEGVELEAVEMTSFYGKVGEDEFGYIDVSAQLPENEQNAPIQWQFLVPGTEDTWVNIQGATDKNLKLNYSMVANAMVEEDGTTYATLRYQVGGEYSEQLIVYTDPQESISLLDLYSELEQEAEPEKPVILDYGKIEIHKLTEPTEPTEATEAPTEPVEETTAPAEETTAPTEEVTEATTVPTEEPEETEEDVAPQNLETDPIETTVETTEETEELSLASFLGLDALVIKASADETTPDVKKTYNIVVNYIFENNTIVSDPYTASLAEGSSFSATVTFPTVQGYLPYVNDVQHNSMELNYASISEDVTINVVYKPTNVNYTVIHYQQNVDNDSYTIESTETKQGLTGSTVPEVAKIYEKEDGTTYVDEGYEGFYTLIYERPAIAADGSTEIHVYYDRYYYLMNFALYEGYGTEPIYARYGASIGTVTNPTKAGYTFGGWSEDPVEPGQSGTAVTLPTTMPAETRTYYAIWTTGTAPYTIVYMLQNADPNEDGSYGYSYLGSASASAQPGAQVSGSDGAADSLFPDGKTYYSFNAEKTEKNVSVNADGSTAVKVYYDRKDYTLKFYYMRSYTTTSNGGLAGGNTTTYQIPKNTNGSSAQNGTVSHATWTNVNVAVTLKSGYTPNTETKSESIGNQKKTVTVTYYYLTLTAKYGADLSASWPNAPFNNVGSSDGTYKFVSWGTQYGSGYNTSNTNKNIKGVYSILNKELIVSNSTEHTLVSYWATGPTMYSYEIYYSLLDGETADRTYNSQGYKKQGTYTVGSTDTPSGQSPLTFPGVTFVALNYDSNNKVDGTVVRFYYKRNEHTITFNDSYGGTTTVNTVYGQDLSSYSDKTCNVPSAIDPNAYTFGGWYQDPTCTIEADFNITMTDENLVFYASWNPYARSIEFHLTESSGVYHPAGAETEAKFVTFHGSGLNTEYVNSYLTIEAMNKARPNGDYTFVMWYYYENGEKKPFDPSTAITKNLVLFGGWSSNTLKQYTVQYVLKDDHSVKVADDLTGSGLAGTTKTFDAKGGTELYATYQEGYFPTVQSQSLLLDIESNSLVITFEYVPMLAVPYTVKYVEKDTGKSLADDKVVSDNRKAVVTETFKPISGYMPDAYQKRLVVTADGENILYFYYSKDETHAYYKITHYIQNTDGETFTEYASSQVVGDIGTTYNADPMTITGFTYKAGYSDDKGNVEVKSGELTINGLELKLYYVRNEYPYVVRYLEQGSGNVLHDPKNGTGKYGQVVSESAIDIDGYDKVDPSSVTLNIRIDEGEGAPNINIITFYYKEQEVTINYVAVGPTGATNFGSVAPTTETVKVKSGTAQGSTPTAGDGFKFVGWYKDEGCTQPVDESWVTDNKIVPQKTDDKNVAATYYAKFEYDVADLKITKTGCDSADVDQTFIFTVTGTKGYSTKVVIKGNGSVTIKNLEIDTYTIHEENGWSWRYDCEDQTVTLQPGVTNNVTMTNKRDKTKWLDGNAYAENVFKK